MTNYNSTLFSYVNKPQATIDFFDRVFVLDSRFKAKPPKTHGNAMQSSKTQTYP